MTTMARRAPAPAPSAPAAGGRAGRGPPRSRPSSSSSSSSAAAPAVARFLVVDLFNGEGGTFSGTAEAMLGRMRRPLRPRRREEQDEVELGAVLSADASADMAAAHRAVQGALKERFGSSWETLAWPAPEDGRRPAPPCPHTVWLGSKCREWTPEATARYIGAVARHYRCTHMVLLGSPSCCDISGANLLRHVEVAGPEAALSVHWLLSVVHLVSRAASAGPHAPRLAWWSMEQVSSTHVERALRVWADASPHMAWARVPMHLCCDGRSQERRFRLFAAPAPLLDLVLRGGGGGEHSRSLVVGRTWERLLQLEPQLAAAAAERNPPRLASGRVVISKRHDRHPAGPSRRYQYRPESYDSTCPSAAHRLGRDLLPTFTGAGAGLWLRVAPRAEGGGDGWSYRRLQANLDPRSMALLVGWSEEAAEAAEGALRARGVPADRRRQGVAQGVPPAFAAHVCAAAMQELRKNHRYPAQHRTLFGEFPSLLFRDRRKPSHLMLMVIRLRVEAEGGAAPGVRAADRSDRLAGRRRAREEGEGEEPPPLPRPRAAVIRRTRDRDAKRRRTVRALVDASGLSVEEFWEETVRRAAAGVPARWFARWGQASLASPTELRSFLLLVA